MTKSFLYIYIFYIIGPLVSLLTLTKVNILVFVFYSKFEYFENKILMMFGVTSNIFFWSYLPFCVVWRTLLFWVTPRNVRKHMYLLWQKFRLDVKTRGVLTVFIFGSGPGGLHSRDHLMEGKMRMCDFLLPPRYTQYRESTWTKDGNTGQPPSWTLIHQFGLNSIHLSITGVERPSLSNGDPLP